MRHGWAFVHKHADVALRLGQLHGPLQRRNGSSDVALHLVAERLHDQNFDDAPGPFPFFCCFLEALQQSHCLTNGVVCPVALISSEQHPRQGNVLKLAQVAEIVLNRQSAVTHPVDGFNQPSLGEPHPYPRRRYGTHIGGEGIHIETLCLVEQVESAVQISLGLPYPSHRHAPAIPIPR